MNLENRYTPIINLFFHFDTPPSIPQNILSARVSLSELPSFRGDLQYMQNVLSEHYMNTLKEDVDATTTLHCGLQEAMSSQPLTFE